MSQQPPKVLSVAFEWQVGDVIVRRSSTISLPEDASDSTIIGYTLAAKHALDEQRTPTRAEIIQLVGDHHGDKTD